MAAGNPPRLQHAQARTTRYHHVHGAFACVRAPARASCAPLTILQRGAQGCRTQRAPRTSKGHAVGSQAAPAASAGTAVAADVGWSPAARVDRNRAIPALPPPAACWRRLRCFAELFEGKYRLKRVLFDL